MPYFKIAGFVLIAIGVSHLAGHFILLPFFHLAFDIGAFIPANDTERQLLKLMNEYHKPVSGATVSMMDIQNGLSLCYALFFLWSGLMTLIIYKPLRRNHRLLARVSLLNAIILAVGTLISVIYFFWLPAASFGLATVGFLLAYLTFAKSRQF